MLWAFTLCVALASEVVRTAQASSSFSVTTDALRSSTESSSEPSPDTPHQCGPMTCRTLILASVIVGSSLVSVILVVLVVATNCCRQCGGDASDGGSTSPLLARPRRNREGHVMFWADDDDYDGDDDDGDADNEERDGGCTCPRTCSYRLRMLRWRLQNCWWRCCGPLATGAAHHEDDDHGDEAAQESSSLSQEPQSIGRDASTSIRSPHAFHTEVHIENEDGEDGLVLVLPTRRAQLQPTRAPPTAPPITDDIAAQRALPATEPVQPVATITQNAAGLQAPLNDAACPNIGNHGVESDSGDDSHDDGDGDGDDHREYLPQPVQPTTASASTTVSLSSRSSCRATPYEETPQPLPQPVQPSATKASSSPRQPSQPSQPPPPPPPGFYWPREVKLDANFRPIKEDVPAQPVQPVQPVQPLQPVQPRQPSQPQASAASSGSSSSYPFPIERPGLPPTAPTGRTNLSSSLHSRHSSGSSSSPKLPKRAHAPEPWQPVASPSPPRARSTTSSNSEPMQPLRASAISAATPVSLPQPQQPESQLASPSPHTVQADETGPQPNPPPSSSSASVAPVEPAQEQEPHAAPTTQSSHDFPTTDHGDFLLDDLSLAHTGEAVQFSGHGLADDFAPLPDFDELCSSAVVPIEPARRDASDEAGDGVRPSSLHIFSGSTTSASSVDTARSLSSLRAPQDGDGSIIELPSSSASQSNTPVLHASTPPPAETSALEVVVEGAASFNASTSSSRPVATRGSPHLGVRSSKAHYRARNGTASGSSGGRGGGASLGEAGPTVAQSVDPRFYTNGGGTHGSLFGSASATTGGAAGSGPVATSSEARRAAQAGKDGNDDAADSDGDDDGSNPATTAGLFLSASVGGGGLSRGRVLTSRALDLHAHLTADSTNNNDSSGNHRGFQFPWSDAVSGHYRVPSPASLSASSSSVSGGSRATVAPLPGSRVPSERLSVSTPSGVSDVHDGSRSGKLPTEVRPDAYVWSEHDPAQPDDLDEL